MRHSEIDLSVQFILMSLLLVVWAAFLIRTALFVRLEVAGVEPLYPASWNPAQKRTLEKFRLLIGLSLLPLWAAYIAITSSRHTNGTLEYLEMFSLILMVSVCYAWTLLLAPRDLRMLDSFPRSFVLMFAFLVIWWMTAFSVVGWMLTRVSAPPVLGLPNRAYALSVELPPKQHSNADDTSLTAIRPYGKTREIEDRG